MSTYPLKELLTRWKNGRLTAEQMIGHLLQHVLRQQAEINALQRQVRALEKKVEEK